MNYFIMQNNWKILLFVNFLMHFIDMKKNIDFRNNGHNKGVKLKGKIDHNDILFGNISISFLKTSPRKASFKS